jgi:hypothetical protein
MPAKPFFDTNVLIYAVGTTIHAAGKLRNSSHREA